MATKLGVRSPLDVNGGVRPRDRAGGDGRLAARHGVRLRDACRGRRLLASRWRSARSILPDRRGHEGRLGQAEAQARDLRRRRVRGHPHPRARTSTTAPARPRSSATRRPARPERPRSTPTPGSAVTRRGSERRSGSGYPKGKIPMESVHGISVAGGTFPAQIWRLFMSSAIGGLEPVSFSEPQSTGPSGRRSCAGTEDRSFGYGDDDDDYAPPASTRRIGGGGRGRSPTEPSPRRRRDDPTAGDAARAACVASGSADDARADASADRADPSNRPGRSRAGPGRVACGRRDRAPRRGLRRLGLDRGRAARARRRRPGRRRRARAVRSFWRFSSPLSAAISAPWCSFAGVRPRCARFSPRPS